VSCCTTKAAPFGPAAFQSGREPSMSRLWCWKAVQDRRLGHKLTSRCVLSAAKSLKRPSYEARLAL
jgi:hypothetical protein